MKDTIDWSKAPKLKTATLVGHLYNKKKKPGNFGQWVFITHNGEHLWLRASPYFTPASINLKKKRFIKIGEKGIVERLSRPNQSPDGE